jgi:hypothetical protein
MARRLAAAAAAALTLLAAWIVLVPEASAGPSKARAVASYRALQKYFYVPRHKLYKGSPFSKAWPFSQAFAATVRMSELPGIGGKYEGAVRERLRGLDRYWDPGSEPPGFAGGVMPPLGRGGTKFYDDNEWIGLELVRRYRASHSGLLLSRAEKVFDLVIFGWDNDPTHACPGGVLFNQDSSNHDRNTITNAPGAQLGAELYRITHNRTYLDWSKRMYEWVRGCLMNSRGLFEDHIDFSGDINRTIWSYNQGVMVGANVLLYRTTHQADYLRRAKRGARAALAFFTQNRLRHQPAFFVAIMFDNLLALDALRPSSRIRGTAAKYADWAWRKHRNKRSNAFSFPVDPQPVLNQSAMVRLYAVLARIGR